MRRKNLSLYMFQAPRKAKRLYFDDPEAVDEYVTFVDKFAAMDEAQKLTNPAFHIHNGDVRKILRAFSRAFANLVSASNAENKDVLYGLYRHLCAGHGGGDASVSQSPDRLCFGLLSRFCRAQ